MMCPRVCEPQLFCGSNADSIYRHDRLTPKVCVCVCVCVCARARVRACVVGKLVSRPSCRK